MCSYPFMTKLEFPKVSFILEFRFLFYIYFLFLAENKLRSDWEKRIKIVI